MQAKRDRSDYTSSSIPVLPVAQVIQAVLGAKPDVLFEVGLDDTSGLYIYARRNTLVLMLSLSQNLRYYQSRKRMNHRLVQLLFAEQLLEQCLGTLQKVQVRLKGTLSNLQPLVE